MLLNIDFHYQRVTNSIYGNAAREFSNFSDDFLIIIIMMMMITIIIIIIIKVTCLPLPQRFQITYDHKRKH